MQSSQTFDIHTLVNEAVKDHHVPNTPEWQNIPQIMGLTHDTLKLHKAPLDDVLAVLEAIYLSLKGKVNYHMFDWESADILKFGTLLTSIDSHLEMAGDELLRYGNLDSCAGHLWPVFDAVREAWNELFVKGCISV